MTGMNEIYQDEERVQYDGKDPERIKSIAEGVTVFCISAIEALGNYNTVITAPASEDSAYDTKIARQEVVEAWANLNHMTQKMAWALRIEADEAATRLTQAIKDGNPVSMEGM